MIYSSIETRLYFDCNEKAEEDRIKLARHLIESDKSSRWEIHFTTFGKRSLLSMDMPCIILTYPVAEANNVAKTLTLWTPDAETPTKETNQ